MSLAPHRHIQAALLRKHYNFPSLHAEQQQCVDRVLSGADVFLTAPTSFGKSLCYALPALVLHALPAARPSLAVSICISPLIALMTDQVSALRARNVTAAMLSSSQTDRENTSVLASLSGLCPPVLLYVTAERVATSRFQDALRGLHSRGRLGLFAVDEAHCVSSWGHDFRKPYAELGLLKRLFPTVPVIALTGSARPRVAIDIVQSLGIGAAKKVHKSFLRENIRYEVRYVDGELCSTTVEDDMCELILARKGQRGIVYAHKRDTVEHLVKVFQGRGISCAGYHGKMANKDKKAVQENFETGKVDLCVCTNAFGMGIDISDLRYILNSSLPPSLENYYQESGRGGRDGAPALSVIYFGAEDARLKRFLAGLPPPGRPSPASDDDRARAAKTKASIDRATVAVGAVIAFCETASKCRRVQLLSHFGEEADAANICGAHGCDVCKGGVQKRMFPAYRRSAARKFGAGRSSGFLSAAKLSDMGKAPMAGGGASSRWSDEAEGLGSRSGSGTGFMTAKTLADVKKFSPERRFDISGSAAPRRQASGFTGSEFMTAKSLAGGKSTQPLATGVVAQGASGAQVRRRGGDMFSSMAQNRDSSRRHALSDQLNFRKPPAKLTVSRQVGNRVKGSVIPRSKAVSNEEVESFSDSSSDSVQFVCEEKAPKRSRQR